MVSEAAITEATVIPEVAKLRVTVDNEAAAATTAVPEAATVVVTVDKEATVVITVILAGVHSGLTEVLETAILEAIVVQEIATLEAIRGQEIATMIVAAVLIWEPDPTELQMLLEAGISEATVDQETTTMQATKDQEAATMMEVTAATEMVLRTQQQEPTKAKLVRCPLSNPRHVRHSDILAKARL